MTYAQEFIVTTVQYLADGSAIDLGIMAKAAVRPQLSVRATTLGSVILVCLPLMVLAAALLVLVADCFLSARVLRRSGDIDLMSLPRLAAALRA